MITEQQVQWAIDILLDRDAAGAKSRAAHDYLQDMDKVILARLISEAPPDLKTATARENWARMHPDYITHLQEKRAIAEADYKARDRRAAASAIIEAWRTECSNARAGAKIG
jgi:ABC-type taurine transport system substrate-binding protein